VRVEPEISARPAQSYRLPGRRGRRDAAGGQRNKLLDELDKAGFIALYISFDTGKVGSQADGQATVREIVSALRSGAGPEGLIEGHTDDAASPRPTDALRRSARRA